MSHFTEKAERVACDLNQGQIRDAANVLRTELDCNPREALQLIQMANQMRDPRGPDHIVVQNGNVFIRDEYHRTQTYAGHLDFNRNYGRQDDCDRDRYNYRRQDDCDRDRYDRGRYDRDRYDNRDRYNYGRQDDCDRDRYDRDRYDRDRYDQGRYDRYPNGADCPPGGYRPPEVYPRQQIYIPDCYGHNERNGLNPGTAALLVLGGVVLGRSLGGHGGGQFTIRERW
jgi:hypothetical protein